MARGGLPLPTVCVPLASRILLIPPPLGAQPVCRAPGRTSRSLGLDMTGDWVSAHFLERFKKATKKGIPGVIPGDLGIAVTGNERD